jgi:Gp157 protein
MSTLLEISQDIRALEQLLDETAEGTTDTDAEAALDRWFSDLAHDRNTKIDNYVAWITELMARAAARKSEMDRLAVRVRVGRREGHREGRRGGRSKTDDGQTSRIGYQSGTPHVCYLIA